MTLEEGGSVMSREYFRSVRKEPVLFELSIGDGSDVGFMECLVNTGNELMEITLIEITGWRREKEQVKNQQPLMMW